MVNRNQKDTAHRYDESTSIGICPGPKLSRESRTVCAVRSFATNSKYQYVRQKVRQRLDGAWHLAHQSAKPLHSMAIALLFVEPRRWLYGGRNRRQPVSICTIKWPYSEYGELYGERASARSLLQGSGGRLELGQSSGQSSGSGQSHLSFSTSGPFWIVSLR